MDEIGPEEKMRIERAFEFALLNVDEQQVKFDAPVAAQSMRVRDRIKIKYPRLASLLIPVYAKLRRML